MHTLHEPHATDTQFCPLRPPHSPSHSQGEDPDWDRNWTLGPQLGVCGIVGGPCGYSVHRKAARLGGQSPLGVGIS